MDHPMMRRLNASITAAQGSLPSRVGCSVMSVIQSSFGRRRWNFRLTRSSQVTTLRSRLTLVGPGSPLKLACVISADTNIELAWTSMAMVNSGLIMAVRASGRDVNLADQTCEPLATKLGGRGSSLLRERSRVQSRVRETSCGRYAAPRTTYSWCRAPRHDRSSPVSASRGDTQFSCRARTRSRLPACPNGQIGESILSFAGLTGEEQPSCPTTGTPACLQLVCSKTCRDSARMDGRTSITIGVSRRATS